MNRLALHCFGLKETVREKFFIYIELSACNFANLSQSIGNRFKNDSFDIVYV